MSPTPRLYSMPSLLTMHCSHMRTENSLLRSNHLEEKVAGIGGEDGSTIMSFGDLVFGSELHLPSLADSLRIPSSEADSKVSLLNEIFRRVGVSCTDSMHFSLLIHRVTLCALPDPVQGDPFEEQSPPDPDDDKPLMSATEVPLYIFLAYLTMFVYSSVVL